MHFKTEARKYTDPEKMAADYLKSVFGEQKIQYPINPFALMKKEGILFKFMDSHNLEGVYIPANSENDIPVVGINFNRNITRQRFTAAHELCHHFKDADRPISCPINGIKNNIEKFADRFASSLLMPFSELKTQIEVYKKNREDDILYFDDIRRFLKQQTLKFQFMTHLF
ncbi:ImmA/IrrE family metallo-endopeptidase [bacterium]|nr:ImmA/IrrE family metallo-endopeptidase [bacterium]